MHHPALLAAVSMLVLGAACTSPGAPAQQTSQNERCIQAARIQSQDIVSNQEIQFTLAGGEVWSNRLPRTCPGLKAQGFSWDASTSICSNVQTIYVIDSGIPCQLGEFTQIGAGGRQS